MKNLILLLSVLLFSCEEVIPTLEPTINGTYRVTNIKGKSVIVTNGEEQASIVNYPVPNMTLEFNDGSGLLIVDGKESAFEYQCEENEYLLTFESEIKPYTLWLEDFNTSDIASAMVLYSNFTGNKITMVINKIDSE